MALDGWLTGWLDGLDGCGWLGWLSSLVLDGLDGFGWLWMAVDGFGWLWMAGGWLDHRKLGLFQSKPIQAIHPDLWLDHEN